MYRQDQPMRGPPPRFMPIPNRPPFVTGGPGSVAPPGHLPHRPGGPFPASDSLYLRNRPPRGHYMSPHCSNFSIDRSTVIALGGNQQIVPPADSPHPQVPQWNPPPKERLHSDSSDRAGEEFLRCIAANKPLPDYLKGNMAFNLAEALQSADAVKAVFKSVAKSRSRSRSRSRTRGKSRAKSRARSKSRGRSKSCVRDRNRAKSKARGRSTSRSKNSHKRSKSHVRRSRSRSSSSERSHGKDKRRKRSPDLSSNSSVTSSNNLTGGGSLLEGLKLVMTSKDVEGRLPTLKDAILSIQASGGIKKGENESDEHTNPQHDCRDIFTPLENDSMLLPHERVVGDFSWLQEKSKEEISLQKAKEFEEEESFLYGTEGLFHAGEHAKHLGVQDYQQMASSAFARASLDQAECEKIKNILSSLGETSNMGKMMMKTQVQKEGSEVFPSALSSDTAVETLKNPNVRKALESLQSFIKVTNDKRTRSDGKSETSSDKQKTGDSGDKKRGKQIKIKQMESLAKELEDLLREDGMSFLSTVIGFYCQKCEEFIGDLNSLESHAAIHSLSSSSQKEKPVKKDKDSKGHSHHHSSSSRRSRSSERRDHSGYSHHKDSGGHRNGRDRQEKGPNTGQENKFLKEEMKKERMLITVKRGLTPPPQPIRIKEENKEVPIKEHGKVKSEDGNKASKKSNNAYNKDSSESSGSSDDGSPKAKHPKKKKKKEKKKKKGKGDRS